MLRRARLAAAQAALAAGDPDLAARHAQAAMTADALDEAAHRWYMSAAAAAAGEPARALAAYAVLRERLAEELGADPAPQTQQLHLAILRDQPAGRRRRPAARIRTVHDVAGRTGHDVRAGPAGAGRGWPAATPRRGCCATRGAGPPPGTRAWS